MSYPEPNATYEPREPTKWRKLAIVRTTGDFFYCNTCPDCVFRDAEDMANHYLERHDGTVLCIRVPDNNVTAEIIIGLPRLS